MPAPKDPEACALWRQRLLARPKRKRSPDQAAKMLATRRALGQIPEVPKRRRSKLSTEEKAVADQKRRGRMSALAKSINGTPEMRAKRSASNRKRIANGHDPLWTAETRAKRSEAARKRRWSAETKLKMSVARAAYLQSEDFSAKYPIPVSTKQKGRRRFVRFSYERAVIRLLEAESSVAAYQIEPMKVPYIDASGAMKTTVPDLLVWWSNGARVLVEVKASWAVARQAAKLSAMRVYAHRHKMGFAVLTEVELSGSAPLAGVRSST